MRNWTLLIGCLMLGSCKVRPAAFMPSSSIAYFSDKVEVSSDGTKVGAFEAPTTEFPKELLKSPKEVLKEDPQISSIAPEIVAVEKVTPVKQRIHSFHNEAARPDSIPDLRKTEPMGVVAALTGIAATAGLLGNYRLFRIPAIILLVMLAVGASLGTASLVRIGDDPRKYKGRFGGWLSIFLASLPILYFVLIAFSYK